ncbi:hypothetical protein LG299_16285 [Microbacterium lacus]|uniref:hypothetical protein n=1 Tax=Microbacterium lacus TaxID=415217 RepID=UPI003850EC11
MTTESPAPPSVSVLRRLIVWIIVISFGLAAIGGITVLLGGSLGEPAGKVLATTAIVGAFSVAVLCCASLLGRRLRAFGVAGVVISLVTLAWSLVLLWASEGLPQGDAVWRLLGTGIALTAASALASLLLLLADRRRPVVRVGLWVTLGLFAIVVAMVIYLIWAGDVDSDVFPRVLGIVAILAALGAVIVPVMSLLLRDDAAERAAVGSVTDASARAIADRVQKAAARRGLTIEQFLDAVDPAVDPVHGSFPPAPRPGP